MADDAGSIGKGVREIGVTEFKAKSLGLIDDVEKGRLESVILTRRGKPVARLSSVSGARADVRPRVPDPWGCMKGSVILKEGVDLTEPTGAMIGWDPFGDD